jgi:hypothetical protein
MIASHDLTVFIVSTAVSTLVAIFDHWLASNPKLKANSTWQFIDRLLHGLSQQADIKPSGIEQRIISGVASVAEHAAEESINGPH